MHRRPPTYPDAARRPNDTLRQLPVSVWPAAQQVAATQRRGRYVPESTAHPGKMLPEIAQFQVRQDRPEAIRILYVEGTGFAPQILERVRADILRNCRFPLQITFEPVEQIPLEQSNKRRFVISTVPF